MEAARILYPHLQVRGIRQMQLIDMIQCPPEVPRPSGYLPPIGTSLREIVCDFISIDTGYLSTGRLTDRFTRTAKAK